MTKSRRSCASSISSSFTRTRLPPTRGTPSRFNRARSSNSEFRRATFRDGTPHEHSGAVQGPALFPQERRRHRIFGGLTERQEHIFTWIAVVVILLYITAWAGAIRIAFKQQKEIESE